MANSAVLKEYLIKLGFKVDDDQFRKIEQIVSKTEKVLTNFGEVVALTAIFVDKNVVQMADQFDKLYYAAQQMNTSVKNLQTFQFAAKMVGVSGDQAAAGIANMARAIRMNPMLQGYLQQLGVKPGRDTATMQNELFHKLAKIPRRLALQIGENLGQDPDTLNQILNNLPEYDKAIKQRQEMFAKAGLNPDDVAKNSAEFTRDMTTLDTDIEILRTIILDKFLPYVDKLVRAASWAAGGLTAHPNVTAFGGLAAFVGGGFLAKKLAGSLLRNVGKQLGLRGGAAAGEAAVGGGEAVAGAEAAAATGAEVAGAEGIAATGPIGLAILGIAAAVVGIYEIVKHWGDIKAGAKKLWDGLSDDNIKKHFGILGGGNTEKLAAAIEQQEGYYTKGTRPNRNNNPGDIEYGNFAKSHGATGSDGRFAIFPNYNAGHAALLALLQSKNYRNLTVAQAITRLGPPNENDTAAYIRAVTASTGLKPDDRLGGSIPDTRLGTAGGGGAVSVQQKTDIHVVGGADPAATGRAVMREQKHVNADLARNVAGVAY